MLEEGRTLTSYELSSLQTRWADFLSDVRPFLDDSATIHLDVKAYEFHLAEILRGTSATVLAEHVRLWRLDPIEKRFEVLARSAIELASRLGKGKIEVECDAGGLWVDPKPMQALWASLVHVVRNCVDHGLETPAARAAAGKPEHGRITLRAQEYEAGRLWLDLSDDGTGIDWDAVKRKAVDLCLPAETEADLPEALFQPGFSTRDEVSTSSGRGVGTSAVRQELQNLGGSVEVFSRPGHGTLFRCVIPTDKLSLRHGHVVQRTSFTPAA